MRNIVDAIRRNEHLFGDREAVMDDSRRLTHSELAARAWSIAGALRSLGVKERDSVGVLTGNSVFAAETFLGVVAAGGAYVPYNWRWSAVELAAGINTTGASVVLVAAGMRDKLDAALATGSVTRSLTVLEEGAELESALLPGDRIAPDIEPTDPACVLFTGGTTGFSKGVVLSHQAALSNCLNEIADCQLGARPDDRGLIATPMFHSAALLCWFLPHYITGNATFLIDRFDEQHVADIVDREKITNMFLVPNMIRRMQKANVLGTRGFQTYLRALHSGAGLLKMPDKLALRELLPNVSLFFRYGLTEAGPMVTRLLPHDMLDPSVDGSIGVEYLLTEVELRDPNTNAPVATGDIGEIWVRGPGLMTEYYGQPDATAEVLQDGWLRTGDLASRDTRGYLYFHDRAKDMIKPAAKMCTAPRSNKPSTVIRP
jgi:fatty-acyl-CoA synthase